MKNKVILVSTVLCSLVLSMQGEVGALNPCQKQGLREIVLLPEKISNPVFDSNREPNSDSDLEQFFISIPPYMQRGYISYDEGNLQAEEPEVKLKTGNSGMQIIIK